MRQNLHHRAPLEDCQRGCAAPVDGFAIFYSLIPPLQGAASRHTKRIFSSGMKPFRGARGRTPGDFGRFICAAIAALAVSDQQEPKMTFPLGLIPLHILEVNGGGCC